MEVVWLLQILYLKDLLGKLLRSKGSVKAALRVGSEVNAGASLHTDRYTRAEIALSDGSHIALRQSTQLSIASKPGHHIHLKRGTIVTDVSHQHKGNATYRLPFGKVEVLGTKFALTAADEICSVVVARGKVRISNEKGDAQDINPGQEGVLHRDGRIEVTPVLDIPSFFEWSEFEEKAGVHIRSGLGELRAKRPGEKRAKERPLSLSSQKVQVRIAGNMARTEVTQTFRNDGPHTLEGNLQVSLTTQSHSYRSGA